MATDTWTDASDNWNTPADWSGGVPTASSNAVVPEGDPEITAPIDIASLNDSAQVFFHEAGASSVSGAVTNTGALNVDSLGGITEGGSTLSIGSTLTNDGVVNIGIGSLSAPTVVTATGLANFIGTTLGTINLTGNSTSNDGGPALATLDIAAAAGFGATGELVGSVNLSGNALLEFASGEITTIGGSSELTLNGPDAFVADASNISANSALTGLATIIGTFAMEDGPSLTTSAGLTNAGALDVDSIGGINEGGSTLNVTGRLTNSGIVNIGIGSLSAPTEVTATGLVNFVGTTLGTINLAGNASLLHGGPFLATFDIAGAASFGVNNTLLGSANLSGDSLLEFASGEIATIAASSELTINGSDAFVADASNTAANSALTGLTTIVGTFAMEDGPSLTTSVGLTNSGTLNVDSIGGINEGGSTLTIGGTLTNSGRVNIGIGSLSSASTVTATGLVNAIGTTLGTIDIAGNTTSNAPLPINATLDIGSAAGFGTAGVLTGAANLTGNQFGSALLEFASGEITTIAASSELTLNGPDAFVADASNISANSALTGLATIAGTLSMEDGPSLTTSVGLTNSGTLDVDSIGGIAEGGSTLTIGGVLVNTGIVNIGIGNLSSAGTVTATGLINTVGTALGTINIVGNTQSNVPLPVNATLDIGSAAGFGTAGVLSGSANLTGNQFGSALLEFASGEIATIAASSELTLDGPDAFVADASNTSANSALTGLATIVGTLSLLDGPSLTTSQGLTNSGTVNVDSIGGINEGGSTLTIGGTLTNSGRVNIGIGSLSSASTVTATGLANAIGATLGTINIAGNTQSNVPAPVDATLDIGSAAGFGTASVLTGSANLTGNQFGSALLEFASGEITTIAASSELTLDGPDAFVADASNISANSALTGLATIAGSLAVLDGPSLTTSQGLVNSGTVNVDSIGGIAEGGSTLTIGGTLTNSGTVNIGINGLSAAATVTATGLDNASGTINVTGSTNGDIPGLLTVNGDAFNDGAVNIGSAGEVLVTGNSYVQVGGATTISGTLSATAIIIAGGAFDVASGGTLDGTVYVSSGGTASDVTITSGGDEFIEPGGSANGAMVAGGNQVVSGTVSGTVIAGGYLYLEQGTASGTVVSSGVELVAGTASGTIDFSGGFDFVYGSAVDTVVSGGDEYVEVGAFATGTVVDSGAQVVYGTVSSTTLNSGTSAYLEPGSVAGGYVVNGGLAVIYGDVTGVVVNSTGFDFVEPGGNVTGTVISGAPGGSGLAGGEEYIESSAVASGTILNGGAQVDYGLTVGTVVNGGAFEFVEPGGTASGTIVNSGVESIFGSAFGTVVNSGGEAFVNDGDASGTLIEGGDELVEFATVDSGSTVSGTGSEQFVYGTAVGATLVADGVQAVEVGGVASATAVETGGYEFVASGGTAAGVTDSGGIVELASGGIATGPIALAGGAILKLDDSQDFSGTVAGFGQPDQIDLEDIAFGASTTLGFAAAGDNQSGTLTVTDGTRTANLTLLGQYTAGQFHLATDGAAGTLVTDPPPIASSEFITAYAGPVPHG